jgi:hypothetical protein
MNYAINPVGPCCAECGPKFIEEMSEVSPSLCLDCAERAEFAEQAALKAERAAEFRYASRYWLAVRPIIQTRMCDLVDQKEAEDAILESAALARFMLGERFFNAPHMSSDRDNRELENVR